MTDPANTNDKVAGGLDQAEFERCFAQFSGGVRAFLRSKLGSEQDADDVFSRVFEKLWKHGAQVQPAARGGWLFVVAKQEIALHWRNQQRLARQVEIESLAPLTTNDVSPETRLIEQEQQQRIADAAQCLSPAQQQVIQMRFVQDLSFQQIAQRLGIPLGTALSRAHSAIGRLRSILNS